MGEGPGLAVAGVEGVEDLADEVGLARGVEARGDRAPEGLVPLLLRPGDVRVERLRGRREEVRRVAAHLVQVHRHVRVPVQEQPQPAACFRLGLGEPVAVHVEEVVVRPATRPPLVVLRRRGLRVGRSAAAEAVGGQKPGSPVGVLQGVDEHEGLAPHEVRSRVLLRGQEVVGQGQGRVRGRDLVAVDAVHEPHHGRHLADQPVRVGR